MHLKCSRDRATRNVVASAGVLLPGGESRGTRDKPERRVASADRFAFESFFLRGQGLLLRSIYSTLAVTFRGYVTARLQPSVPFRRFGDSP